MPIECSNWAESERSRVTAVQPSSSSFTSGAADVDHRLDGEEHAGLELGPGAGAAGMDDFGAVVEQPADAVAAEIADDAVAVAFGVALDRVGDVAEPVAGPRLLEAEHQAFVGDVDQLARLQRHVADQVHAAGVAVPAVEDRRDVDVDDVAVLERLVARDSVADDMVDRDAAALGVAAIAERRGNARRRRSIMLVDDVVELPVVTPGTTCGTSASRISAASRPARRMPSNPSGPWSLITPLRASTRSSAATVIYSVMRLHIGVQAPDETERSWCESENESGPRRWLVIGDEILSGRTQDKNVAQVATWLNGQGIRLAEVRIVPDDQERIAEAVNALRAAHDYLFTTGGIGPTHDDITVDSIAAAFGVPVIVHPEARQILEDYYRDRPRRAERGAAADGAGAGRRRADPQPELGRARREDRQRLHPGRRAAASPRACSRR